MVNTSDVTDRLKAAREFAQAHPETEYLLVRKHGDNPDVGELEIGRGVQQELDEIVASVLTKHIDNLMEGTTQARPLDVISTINSESVIQCVEVEDLPNTELFDLLNTRDDHPITTYTEEPEPEFQLVRLSEPGGKLLMGIQNYSYYDVQIVDTQSELALWYRDKVYERFASDLLVIPQKLNAVYFDGWLHIISPKAFERMFDMRSEYQRRAEEVITQFDEAGITFVDEAETTEWLLNNLKMLRRMYEIDQNEVPKYATPDKMEEVIEKYDLNIQYNRHPDRIELGVDRYQDMWKLLKLLNDNYAEAEIIDAKWEIDSKRRLG